MTPKSWPLGYILVLILVTFPFGGFCGYGQGGVGIIGAIHTDAAGRL